MNKLKSFGIWGAIGLSILTFVVSVLIAHPSTATATDAKYQRLIAMGVIDAVVTPHELGLDYLKQETIEPSVSDERIELIKHAMEKMALMPEDIALGFPLGTDPIAIGEGSSDDTGKPEEVYDILATGYVGNDGESRCFDPPTIAGMFDFAIENGGSLSHRENANGGFLQTRRVPVFDLIVYSPRTEQHLLISNVNARSVFRDALNAALNETFIVLGDCSS